MSRKSFNTVIERLIDYNFTNLQYKYTLAHFDKSDFYAYVRSSLDVALSCSRRLPLQLKGRSADRISVALYCKKSAKIVRKKIKDELLNEICK